MFEHQPVLAKRGLAQSAAGHGVFEESRGRLGLSFFGRRVPRSARLGLDDQLLRTLPVRGLQALPQETIAALALDVNRAGAAAVDTIMSGFFCGTTGTVQADYAQHAPSLPERGANLLRIFGGQFSSH